MKEIHNFAVKWLDKFRNQEIDYIELVDHYLADDCDALGFEMDSGEEFSKRYGSAVYDYRELQKIILLRFRFTTDMKPLPIFCFICIFL